MARTQSKSGPFCKEGRKKKAQMLRQKEKKTKGIIMCALTFYSLSNHFLGQVRDTSPGVSVICAADVAEPGHVFARHQLVGL